MSYNLNNKSKGENERKEKIAIREAMDMQLLTETTRGNKKEQLDRIGWANKLDIPVT